MFSAVLTLPIHVVLYMTLHVGPVACRSGSACMCMDWDISAVIRQKKSRFVAGWDRVKDWELCYMPIREEMKKATQ